jgi:hypothetical protein
LQFILPKRALKTVEKQVSYPSTFAPHASARTAAWVILGTVIALWFFTFWMRAVTLYEIPGPTGIYWIDFVFWMVVLPFAPPAYATVAAVIIARQTKNVVGWMCLGLAVIILLEDITWLYSGYTLVTAPGALPFGVWAAWLNSLFTGLILPPYFLALMLFYFPNNRLAGRGWLAGVVLAAVSTIAAVLSVFLAPEVVAYPHSFPSPVAPAGMGAAADLLKNAAMIGGVTALLGGAASIVARWRQSDGVERAQIKWLATVSVVLIVVVVAMVVDPGQGQPNLFSALLLLSTTTLVAIGLPAAIGIAVLRYKLWNIDQIIRRTLAYTLVTGLLVLVYFGCVVLLQQIFRAVSGDQSRLSVVISTLAIAALFNPLRQRVQNFIDQRFYRSRYDAVRTLASFSENARDIVELKELSDRLYDVVQGSMRPSRVGVWFKQSGRLDDNEKQAG